MIHLSGNYLPINTLHDVILLFLPFYTPHFMVPRCVPSIISFTILSSLLLAQSFWYLHLILLCFAVNILKNMDAHVGSTAVLMNLLAKSSAVPKSLSFPAIICVTVVENCFLAVCFLWIFSFPLPFFVTVLQPSLTPWLFWYHHYFWCQCYLFFLKKVCNVKFSELFIRSYMNTCIYYSELLISFMWEPRTSFIIQ